MSFMELFQAPPLWVEIRTDSVHLHDGKSGEDVPVAWDAPDDASRARLLAAIGRIGSRKPWQARGTLWCALPSRGISLRKLSVPAGTKDDPARLLALQIESQFPLPPDQLAWGWFAPSKPEPASAGGLRDYTVAAIRKEPVERLAQLFAGAGYNAVFGVAATLRINPVSDHSPDTLCLDVGSKTTESIEYRNAAPAGLRSIPWGTGSILDAIVADTRLPREEAAAVLAALVRGDATTPERRDAILSAVDRSVRVLAEAVNRPGATAPSRVVVTGNAAETRWVATRLADALRPIAVEYRSDGNSQPGLTAAVAGLRAATSSPGGSLPVRLDVGLPSAGTASGSAAGMPWQWIAGAAALLVAIIAFPYAEAIVGRPILRHRLESLRKETARLGEIDRRLEFLQYLADGQAPYIDASYVIATASPPGAKIESISMNRRGELSISGFTQMPQQVVEFRNKLVDSGFFSGVVLEEQTPIVGGQPRINLHITAQWKGPVERESLKLGPVLPDPVKTNAPAATNGAPASKSATNNPPAKS